MALWRASSLQQHIIIHPSYWNSCVSEQQSGKRSSSCWLCVPVPAISLEWWVQKYCDVSWWWNVHWFGWSRWKKRTLEPHFVISIWLYYIVIWMSTQQMYTGCFLSLAGAAPSIIFVGTKDMFCCNKHMFVVINVCMSRQNFCHDKIMFVVKNIYCVKHMLVVTKVLSQQAYFCCDKRHVLSWQTCVCRDKNDTCGHSCQW